MELFKVKFSTVMRKLIFALIMALAFILPKGISAEEVCTSVYGGGVVCGVTTEEHKPVETGLIDNPAILGSALLGSSYILGKFAKRLKNKEV
jgi:hypothetical protein